MIERFILIDLWFLQSYVVLGFILISMIVFCLVSKKKTPLGYPMIISCLCNQIIILLTLQLVLDGFIGDFWRDTIIKVIYVLFILFIVNVKYLVEYFNFDYEYILLLLFSFYGLMLLLISEDFVFFFLAIEMYSLPTYILISYKTFSPKSTEAGLKYFILGCFFSSILVFGISCVYFATGTINFNMLHDLLFIKWNSFEEILIIGIIFICISFAFKLSAVPFHMGTPDAYEGAPLIITTYLSAIPKIPLFFSYYYIFSKCFYNYEYIWTPVFLIISIFSIIWGTLTIIFQQKFVRLLTYSTISNTGFFILSLIGNDIYSISNMFIYQIIYCFITLSIFICLGTLQSQNKKYRFDKTMSLINLFLVRPGFAVVYASFLFSLGSLPPVVGFFGKYTLFVGWLDVNIVFVAIIAILLSVISIIVYLRLIKLAFFTVNPNNIVVFDNIPFPIALILSSMFMFNLVWILFPDFTFYLWLGLCESYVFF